MDETPSDSPELPARMFGIDWLREGVPVDKETSVLTSEAEVIAGAKSGG
jgi:hypothetical protein